MAIDTNFASLFDKLKVEDPWLPPRTWESIPSQSGPLLSSSASDDRQVLGDTSSVSEASLVRLALNALQGVQSALISIDKLSAAFSSDPTDRTFHHIPSLWNRISSTHALGKILKSIGCSGSLVFLLLKFVDHFRSPDLGEKSMKKGQEDPKSSERKNHCDDEVQEKEHIRYSLINQAFTVAVGKVIEGYMCALDTLYASIGLRHSLKDVDLGCLTSVGHSEITLLEVYLHTKELRTQIEALGNICNLHKLALCFSECPLEDLTTKAVLEFNNFCRGGDLLTCLYTQLQVADPAHCSLLKFLFLRSCEPYCWFIRLWIFKAEIVDPYKEFIVECIENLTPCSNGKTGPSIDFPLANIRERDGASIPCFLKHFLIPLIRAGQQLQVLMKLLELCNFAFAGGDNYSDFLPSWTAFSSNRQYSASPLTFSRKNVDAMVIARDSYYEKMEEKLDNLLTKLKLSYQQAVPSSTVPVFLGSGGSLGTSISFEFSESEIVQSVAEERSSNDNVSDKDSEDLSSKDEFFYLEDASGSSECSSLSGFEEQSASKEGIPYISATADAVKSSMEGTLSKDQIEKGCATSNFTTVQDWKHSFDCNIFCRNPMLDKVGLFGTTSKLGLRSIDHELSLPFFDFSSVEDPRKMCVEKLAAISSQELSKDLIISAVTGERDDRNEQGRVVDQILIDNTEVSFVDTPLNLNDPKRDNSANVSGTSSWGSLLCRSNENEDYSVGDYNRGFLDFEIPLDFTIEKCLLQEILMQYSYASKLAIKVLEEGFDLHEHLLALRRYHFMELADWADLFIMSLWHHKWCATEAELRVPEIQGFLELSVQRSSCEQDPYKDRLFVYLKGPDSLSKSTNGVRSFDFLGLGYRMDWPVSLVLTSRTVEIYAEVFSFLIQLKLAIFSLNDVWCTLKDLMHFIYQSRLSTNHQKEVGHFHLLMKLRHQVNHFVSTLQQYVQSQLSHVSWCKLQHSLKHKVKDMMDLESVHMAYLTGSLEICFLSDDNQLVASIIEDILQCALDFRSCLGICDFGLNQGDVEGTLSRINKSQVLAIKQKFNKNLKELHLCYLKSSKHKHKEFGLCRFWEHLNYNEYYSDISNEIGRYAFSM